MQKKVFLVLSLIALTVSGVKTGSSYVEAKLKDVTNEVTQEVTKEIVKLTNSSLAESVEEDTEGLIKTWNAKNPIPNYQGQTSVEINGNIPYFSEEDLTEEAFENYSELDYLGRCGQAYANICIELMPTEERESIRMIKPSGWHTVKYPNVIEDLYLYNRCHLIAFCLAGENANEKNLITGTRHLNKVGMLPYEIEVANYVEETGNHVLYRATPIFVSDELTCRGVEIEALSVEDGGAGVCFHVFIYNEQPGITIDHATGESWEG